MTIQTTKTTIIEDGKLTTFESSYHVVGINMVEPMMEKIQQGENEERLRKELIKKIRG